jgi:hypothetical protein
MAMTTSTPQWTRSTEGVATLGTSHAWHTTRAQTSLATQVQGDKNEYLATEKEEIGRIVGPNERELFVSCEAGLALQQQFEHVHPEFIAVHDIGTTSSRKLLRGLAAASGRALQKLSIRRQGYGQALATLYFLELPATNGQTLRMYTTQAETDAPTRKSVARTLLAFSRLGVVMVGNVSAELLQPELNALRDDIGMGPWHNRNLLMLPLAAASNLVALGVDLADRTGVVVRTTPVVSRPAEAWSYISDTWKRFHAYATPESTPPEPTSASPSSAALVPELAVQQPSGSLPWSGSGFSSTSGTSGFPPGAGASGFSPASGTSGFASTSAGASGYPAVAPQAARPEPDHRTSRPAPTVQVSNEVARRAAAAWAAGAAQRAAIAAELPSRDRDAPPTMQMGLADSSDAARESTRADFAPRLTPAAPNPEQGMLQRYVRLLSALNGLRACCLFDIATGARIAHSGSSITAGELARQGKLLLAAMQAASSTLDFGQALPEASMTLGTHHLLLRGVPGQPGIAMHAAFDKTTANPTLARLQVLRLDALFEEPPRGA